VSGSTDTAETDAPLNRIFTSRLSGPGVAVALFFFALSLQPSLLPRTALFQGVVSGVTMMIGYGLGVVGLWAWNYLGLPKPEPASIAQKVVLGVTVVVVGFVAAASIWRQVGWQNDVREIFGMESISPSVWLLIVPITLAVAAVILILTRAVRKLFQLIARWLNRIMPQRVARLVGGLALFIVLALLINDVLLTGFF
jgi:uncharacterized membrane protein